MGHDFKERRTAAQVALASTIEWLISNEKKVILIGPVPVFDRNVPLALALEQARGRIFLHSSLEEQRLLHSKFFEAIPLTLSTSKFVFLDPIEWLCKTNCKAIETGLPMYRDAHHLSVFGAMELKTKLSNRFSSVVLGNVISSTAVAVN
jgi:hypothetical protein